MSQTRREWIVDEEMDFDIVGYDEPCIMITAKPLPQETHTHNSDVALVSGLNRVANAQLIASAPNCYKELKEADALICELCKRLNPQHATADYYGKGCEWCNERDSRLKALAKAEGK